MAALLLVLSLIVRAVEGRVVAIRLVDPRL